MGKNGKITKKLVEEKPEIRVKLVSQSSPKFAHNAGAAGKGVTWSYEFWKTTDKTKKGTFDIEMDINKYKKMNENKQSEGMNDAAISFVQGEYPDYVVKLTSGS